MDPAFFNAANPGSIVGQLHAFTKFSPIAPLVSLVEPFAIPMGLLIAIAEIAIGIGALTGLGFRLAATGGAILSFTFWLTASWTTKPFYYGADLPYAFGWVALAIAGHQDLFVPAVIREFGTVRQPLPYLGGHGVRAGNRPRGWVEEDADWPGRRTVLQAGALAGIALIVGAASLPIRLLRGDDTSALADSGGSGDGSGAGDGSGGATDAPAGATDAPVPTDPNPEESPDNPSDDPTATPGATPFKASGLTVAAIAAVDRKGAVRIRIPANAPSSLPAGDPALVVKLKNGGYACYDTVCTHEGCRVGWDAVDGIMLCPCHGAAFDPNDHGAVLGGPTNTPLLELPLTIDHAAGTITLKA